MAVEWCTFATQQTFVQTIAIIIMQQKKNIYLMIVIDDINNKTFIKHKSENFYIEYY